MCVCLFFFPFSSTLNLANVYFQSDILIFSKIRKSISTKKKERKKNKKKIIQEKNIEEKMDGLVKKKIGERESESD